MHKHTPEHTNEVREGSVATTGSSCCRKGRSRSRRVGSPVVVEPENDVREKVHTGREVVREHENGREKVQTGREHERVQGKHVLAQGDRAKSRSAGGGHEACPFQGPGRETYVVPVQRKEGDFFIHRLSGWPCRPASAILE